ncbi:hypothetical protein CaCOL14_003164 [Colletotrichum acutatum]|uniref:Uncharacterized protein n=1 Tax=Glomerella acutata TaxID=27357 RepID=A0AAD8UHY9_GLOAC|nr:uncharacterized protein BDZ83DRAFT_441060 [Colletotrichum acutatum]KAK1721213.1 hypothetical protein BDZ83DRAFT_441060 [Colletotrichum acutatum]
MVSALPYSSQSDPTQQEGIPEDTDWSESEPDVTRRSFRHHQRHTNPADNFEDLASQFAWDGTYADPDSLSTHHEARFATGQTVPYRRGHLEGFADPSRHRSPPNRNPPPPGLNDPQGFGQQPQVPGMNYHGVPPPPPPPHPGVYPMHAPPMPHYTPAPRTTGWRNSMGGPRPMGPPPSTYPQPIEPYGPYYAPYQGPAPLHPYAATPRSHANYTGPRPQTTFPRQRKDHYPQYPAPPEPVEEYYAEASAPKPKKQPKLRQEKPPKRTIRDDEIEEMKRGMEDLAFRQQQVHDGLKARERRERKKASEAALKASLVKEVTKTVRKEFQNGANAQLRDIDMRSESSRRMLRSDIGSRGFSTPVPSVYDDHETGSIIQATVMETLRAVNGQSRSDLGGFQAPRRPSHRRAASEVPYSGGGYPPPPRDRDTAATTNPFMPNQTNYGQAPYQGLDPQQRQAQRSEAYWTGRVRKSRTRSENHSGQQLQGDTNVPLHGSLSPGDSGYASPEPLRSERPHGQLRARKVSFRDSDGVSRPRREDVRSEEVVDWSEDDIEVPEHRQRRTRTYRTVAPGHPNFTIEVREPPPTAPEVGHF